VLDGRLVALGEVDGVGRAGGVADLELAAFDAQIVEPGPAVDIGVVEVAGVGQAVFEGADQAELCRGGAVDVGDGEVAGAVEVVGQGDAVARAVKGGGDAETSAVDGLK